MRGFFAWVSVVMLLLLYPSVASADEVTSRTDLLVKLAATSARLETMLKKASFTVTGRMEKVSGDGTASDPKEASFRVVAEGDDGKKKVEVLKYVEDGEDKTAEARKKSEERRKESNKKKSKFEMHLPFLQSEQSKYDFRVGETDANDPFRVRLYFNAKSESEDLLNGSAWVDSRTGELLSMGVAPAKVTGPLDYLRVQLEFGTPTAHGPAISKISFEAGGHFLFIKKRYRGSATVAGYQF